MKNKKILCGLICGAVMATTPFITACKSDITFNQSDLDNAIKNINEYLETQNNYSSEFAKNVLNDYLLKGIERNQYNSQFGYKVTNETKNNYNDSFASYIVDYKFYRDGNTIKEMHNASGAGMHIGGLKINTNNYREIISEYKPIINDPGAQMQQVGMKHYYAGISYCEDFSQESREYTKSTFENKTKDEVGSWMLFGDISNIYSDLMLAVVSPEASVFGVGDVPSGQTDVVMGKDGEYETFAFTNAFIEEDGETMVLSYNLKFLNGVLQSVKFIVSGKDSVNDSMDRSEVLTIQITEHIEDFTIDKTPYQA